MMAALGAVPAAAIPLAQLLGWPGCAGGDIPVSGHIERGVTFVGDD